MITAWVWVLYVMASTSGAGGSVTVIDNIATRESCEHLQAATKSNWTETRCVQVKKVFPK